VTFVSTFDWCKLRTLYYIINVAVDGNRIAYRTLVTSVCVFKIKVVCEITGTTVLSVCKAELSTLSFMIYLRFNLS
jgi:hypothetical protein